MTASQHRSQRIPQHSHLLSAIVAVGLACGGQGDPPLDGAAGSAGDGPLSNAGSGGNPSTAPEGDEGAGEFERCELVTTGFINGAPEPLRGVQLARVNSDRYPDAIASRLACCADTPEVMRNIHVFTGGADG